jgi:hypothetical protein
MIDTVLRFVFVFCGGAMVLLFIALGAFFLAFVFSRQDNGW